MTHKPYPAPPRPTLDDLAPATATTDRLIAMAHAHRAGEDYPAAAVLLGHLPKVLRALCDHRLPGEATALDVAYRLASLIDAIEGCPDRPAPLRRTHSRCCAPRADTHLGRTVGNAWPSGAR